MLEVFKGDRVFRDIKRNETEVFVYTNTNKVIRKVLNISGDEVFFRYRRKIIHRVSHDGRVYLNEVNDKNSKRV